jgi:hypothetical protein
MSSQEDEYYISTFVHAKQKLPNGNYELSFQCTTALKFRYFSYCIFKHLATTTYRDDTQKNYCLFYLPLPETDEMSIPCFGIINTEVLNATTERKESFFISIGGDWVDVKSTEICLLRF